MPAEPLPFNENDLRIAMIGDELWDMSDRLDELKEALYAAIEVRYVGRLDDFYAEVDRRRAKESPRSPGPLSSRLRLVQEDDGDA